MIDQEQTLTWVVQLQETHKTNTIPRTRLEMQLSTLHIAFINRIFTMRS